MGQQQLRTLVVLALAALLPPTSVVCSGNGGGAASALQALQAPGVGRAAQDYERLMRHRHTLSPGHLQRSIAFKGANLRLRRLLNKLLDGQPQHISVGVIGGSISWGHGVQRGQEDWFSLVRDWLQATFRQHTFSFKNGCVPATQSSYVASCLQQFVSADVDLVFVEYVTNDGYKHGWVDNSLTRSFERLLRKLLAFPHAPALVVMAFLSTDVLMNELPFYATIEDHYGVLAQYYSLPWLSYRDAVWHEYMAGDAPGFKRLEIFPEEDERHPTPLGHRYLADMAIHLLQQTFLDRLLCPLDDEQLLHGPLVQVPPPMFEGNWEATNLVCIIGEQLPAAVAHNAGFEWVNEGSAAKPKWGFVSWTVGARLVLKVDARASAGHQVDAALLRHQPVAGPAPPVVPGSNSSTSNMIVWVGYVKSWRHMGTASLTCIGGCSCQPTAVDGMHELGNTQQHMAKLFTTQAKECLVEVKINEWAASKDHKFKVTALMVTHAVEYSGHGDYTDTVLLDSLAGGRDEGEQPSSAAAAGAAGAAAAG